MSINVSNHKLLMEPILRALWEIGYPAPKKEIYDKVIADNDIDEEFLKKIHTYTSGATVPEINYNIDWALTRLKKDFGVVTNVDRGIWEIVNKNKYSSVENLLSVLESENIKDIGVDNKEKDNEENEISWEDEQKVKIENALLEKILMMNEYDFEAFCALIFNKMGCSEVQTTSKSGDHGIDGYGKYKINEIMTSKFAFQCKKFARENKVSEPEMNAFIGACDKYKRGVFITTSSFTKGAIEKAKNSNCVIDLIDGDKLKSILFDLEIGYKASYVLDDELFSNYKFEGQF